MICRILPTFRLDAAEVSWILKKLSKPGSDFQHKLAHLADVDGHIAVVADHGEDIGWARTEHWRDHQGRDWETLEAFVAPEYRRRGLARFAAAGLAASGAIKVSSVAVFATPMPAIATAAGLLPVSFSKDADGRWVRE
jgi:GNAT superfamily N-acetyltransferase